MADNVTSFIADLFAAVELADQYVTELWANPEDCPIIQSSEEYREGHFWTAEVFPASWLQRGTVRAVGSIGFVQTMTNLQVFGIEQVEEPPLNRRTVWERLLEDEDDTS